MHAQLPIDKVEHFALIEVGDCGGGKVELDPGVKCQKNTRWQGDWQGTRITTQDLRWKWWEDLREEEVGEVVEVVEERFSQTFFYDDLFIVDFGGKISHD